MKTNIIQITFNSNKILTIKENNKIYFGVKSICENIGIDFEGQRKRIANDEVLPEGTCVREAPSGSGIQMTLFLCLNYLNGFLFGISLDRLKNKKAKQLLIEYKKDCYQVLARHFFRNPQTQQYHNTIQTLNNIKPFYVKFSSDKIMLAKINMKELTNASNNIKIFDNDNKTTNSKEIDDLDNSSNSINKIKSDNIINLVNYSKKKFSISSHSNVDKIDSNNIASKDNNDKIFFNINSICLNIGINSRTQRERIKKDIIGKNLIKLRARFNQFSYFLPIEYLNEFLLGINILDNKNIKLLNKLKLYQDECYNNIISYLNRLNNNNTDSTNNSIANVINEDKIVELINNTSNHSIDKHKLYKVAEEYHLELTVQRIKKYIKLKHFLKQYLTLAEIDNVLKEYPNHDYVLANANTMLDCNISKFTLDELRYRLKTDFALFKMGYLSNNI